MPLLSGVQRPSVVAVATSGTYRRSALKPGVPSRNVNARSYSDRTYSLLTIFAVLTTPNWQINTVINLKQDQEISSVAFQAVGTSSFITPLRATTIFVV